MTKAELEQIVIKQCGGMSAPLFNDVLNCMVEAYNRALEDAADKVGDMGDPEWSWRYCDWINELKI